MYLQTVVTLPAERRDKRRVDVQNAAGIGGGKRRGQNTHKASQHDEINPVFLQQLMQSLLKSMRIRAVLPHDDGGLDAGDTRPLQRVGIVPVGNDQADASGVQRACPLGINQCLQVGTAARNQNGNADVWLFQIIVVHVPVCSFRITVTRLACLCLQMPAGAEAWLRPSCRAGRQV